MVGKGEKKKKKRKEKKEKRTSNLPCSTPPHHARQGIHYHITEGSSQAPFKLLLLNQVTVTFPTKTHCPLLSLLEGGEEEEEEEGEGARVFFIYQVRGRKEGKEGKEGEREGRE